MLLSIGRGVLLSCAPPSTTWICRLSFTAPSEAVAPCKQQLDFPKRFNNLNSACSTFPAPCKKPCLHLCCSAAFLLLSKRTVGPNLPTCRTCGRKQEA
jgi:hypothetical protein